jgi:2-oxoisovalerate dehydrogenase E1 component alpha subunit
VDLSLPSINHSSKWDNISKLKSLVFQIKQRYSYKNYICVGVLQLKIVAEFKIPYFQYLDENSQLSLHLPFSISTETLIHYYSHMDLMRQFDKKAISLQRTGKMGTYAPIHGQEAIGTVIGHLLGKEDVFIPYYRDYACMVQRGVSLVDILTYWGGNESASLFSHASHDFPLTVPIATQCNHAAGVAFSLKYKKSTNIALVTIGEGGTSEGEFYEALNLAGLWNLPMVCIVLNNHWAISVHAKNQTACQTFAQKAIAAGIEGIQVDGNDVFALHHVVSEAIEKARGPNGKPILIEAITYRLSDHTTADDATRYQPKDEVMHAQKLEPISRLEQYLEAQHMLNVQMKEEIREKNKQMVDDIAQKYLKMPAQSLESIFDYHYATLPTYLIEQRATALEGEEHAHA